mgnify:FL=1
MFSQLSRKITSLFYGLQESGSDTGVLYNILRENVVVYWEKYLLIVFLLLTGSATSGYLAYLVSEVFRNMFESHGREMIEYVFLAGQISLSTIVAGILNYHQRRVTEDLSFRITARYRKRLVSHLIAEGSGLLNAIGSSDFLNSYIHGTIHISMAINVIVLGIFREAMTVIVLSFVLFTHGITFFIIIVTIIASIAAVTSYYSTKTKKLSSSLHLTNTNDINNSRKIIEMMSTIEALSLQSYMRASLFKIIRKSRIISSQISSKSYKNSLINEIVCGLTIALLIIYGGYMITNNHIHPADLMSSITILLVMLMPLRKISSNCVSASQSLRFASFVMQTFHLKSPVQEDSEASDLKLLASNPGTILFNNVCFSYNPQHDNDDSTAYAINNMALEIPAGKITAMVGTSGNGKTTICHLIERFYDPQKGSILIDGQDIKHITLASLRRNIAYVPQSHYLINGSIYENIACVKPKVSKEAVYEACRKSDIHDAILNMPDGYDTIIQDSSQLSTGQLQRVAIARALLSDAPIVILDEITSALDANTEHKIIQTIDELSKRKKTIFIIAHRLSTIRNAHKICVISEGRIHEHGTHDELISLKGEYCKLWSKQQI